MDRPSIRAALQRLFARPASDDPAATGAEGERRAARFLAGRGFAVVARNWRDPGDRRNEIDLVCRHRGTLVFVEVKSRAPGARVPGFHAVDGRKRRALRRAAAACLARCRPRPRTFRFDVVEVEFGPGEPRIRHFENAPLFSKHYR